MGIKEWFAQAQAEHDAHIRPEFRTLAERGNVTIAEAKELRGNSWEWELLVPAYDTQAFLEQLQHTLDNCFHDRRRPCVSYPDALAELYVPELVRRYKAIVSQLFDFGNAGCVACSIEAEIGTEENPHPVPRRFHVCKVVK